MAFERSYRIRFSHCDPAGIVFYPQYFALFNDHVEDWFNAEFSTDFAALHRDRRMGVPTVHIECDFAGPSRHGDEVVFALDVTRIGNSSVHLTREARCGNDVRVRMKQVLACIDIDTGRALPWPDDLRAGLDRWTTPAGTN